LGSTIETMANPEIVWRFDDLGFPPHLPRSSSSARKNLWFAWNSNNSSRGGRCGGEAGGANPTLIARF
jgi:hypothetical protein